MFYITGDTHGAFRRIEDFVNAKYTTLDDTIIILGDSGINFDRSESDSLKKELSKLPINLFCIHGNHEERPQSIETYKEYEMYGGKVFVEDKYPNLIFAKDGEIYNIDGKSVLVIGGAYSVDKYLRVLNYVKRNLSMDNFKLYTELQQYVSSQDNNPMIKSIADHIALSADPQKLYWFKNEQPPDKLKYYIERKLDKIGWKVDVVLTHTCPYQLMPTDAFLSRINETSVDNSTEKWLQKIYDKLEFNKWYCGHFHIDRKYEKTELLFQNIKKF